MIFSQMTRDDVGHPTAHDTHYAYLNRSARPEAGRVRAFLEGCLAKYPAGERAGLVSRLKSNNVSHDAAVFELLLHEMLVNAGHRIVAVEPKLPHTSKSPDFLVESPGGVRYYVECALSTGQPGADVSARKRLDEALEAAGKVPSPHHHISVNLSGLPSESVSLNKLKKDLGDWIGALPQGAAARKAKPFSFAQHGMTLRFSVMMERTKPASGQGRLGAVHHGFHMQKPGKDLRSSIMGKANRYGTLDAPYVVAVDNSDPAGAERDVLDALLGTPAARISVDADGKTRATGGRANDGVWTESGRPRKKGVSAILSFDRMSAWKPNGRGARLIRNPWATIPLPDIGLRVDELNPVDGQFVRTQGPARSTWFGLDDAWPEVPTK